MFHFRLGSIFVGVSVILMMTLGEVAQAQHVRYEARSVEGKKMLTIYAKAVAKMKAIKSGDPDNWTFQWYTHAVRPDKTKVGEIMAIYGAGPSPYKMLAQSMWDTCQPHMPPYSQGDFLPWHRMFVYYFEEIIRDVSGEKSFALPYWDYSLSDRTIHGVIPPEFTMKNDPLYQSLYVENRNPGVNAGQAIDKGQPPGQLSTAVLAECFYDPTSATDLGFCQTLDVGLHGTVHVLVGNGMNMGSVPWAANDPVFWMHHCNIDRLWASWNAGGRANPVGMGSYTFAANKMKVVADVKDWMDLKTEKHGYCYDKLEPVPPCTTTKPALIARVQKQLRVAAMKAKEIKLEASPTKVNLEVLPVKKEEKPLAFHERVRALPNDKREYLIVKNLRADSPPGVLYHLYLDLPDGSKDEKALPHYVGTVNFFAAVKHGNAGHDMMKKGPEASFRFDITDVARKLNAQNLLTSSPVLTILPAGQPAEKANPVIGEISIIEQ